MKQILRSMMVACALALVAVPVGGCQTWNAVYDTFTSTSPTQENAAAAAENLYTATVSLGTAYVRSGKATPAQIDRMVAIESGAYQAVLDIRKAVADHNSVALTTAKAALDAYNAQMHTVTGATP